MQVAQVDDEKVKNIPINDESMYEHVIDTNVFPFLFDVQNTIKGKIATALCVLCFDDEIGQVTENIWPENSLSKDILKTISRLGFPETNSLSDDGDVQFVFKIRESKILNNYIDNHIPLKSTTINDLNFYYCYTLFIQKKDINYKRGYLQKSIIIISSFYHKKLYYALLNEFKQVFIQNIENTQRRISLSKLEEIYNLFNSVNLSNIEGIQSDSDGEERTSEMKERIKYINYIKTNLELSVFPQSNNFFEYLSLYYVSKIWNLWELIITETPLIVQTDTPNECSQIVFLLSSLIFPLKYCGDVRPYFTIYDNDYKDYKDDEGTIKSSHSPILGVINPILVKNFNNWPVLHFDDGFFHEINQDNPTKKLKNFNDELLIIPNYKRKFIMTPNKALIKTFYDYILDEGNKSLDKINIYLRMYLIELNNDFMRTFEDYFFAYECENIKRIVLIKPNFSIFEIFNREKFLMYLNVTNVYFNLKYVKDKKKTNELYGLFIKTKCFQNYLKNLMYILFFFKLGQG